jgi:transposase
LDGRSRGRGRAILWPPRRNNKTNSKKLAEAVAEEAKRHPGVPVEAFSTDEHRLGLKPVARGVWAPIGESPMALGHHRFEWCYVTAFVSPATGECFWYVRTGVSKPYFEELLRAFAEEARAGRDRIIVLLLDNAGRHGPANRAVPEGLRRVFLPPYTPELQPAETLWELVDEPVINKHIPDLEALDEIISRRCVSLADDRRTLKSRTGFDWWPKIAVERKPSNASIRMFLDSLSQAFAVSRP